MIEESVAPGGAAIRLESVSRGFATANKAVFQALSGIDLCIAPGEFVALIGPSGCGKSTLLRLIAALDAPSGGNVRVDDRDPALLARAHRLGVAFQDHALLPWLTIAQNIALPFRIARRPVDTAAVAALIALVGLTGYEDARPRTLSGGMRQRASIARALVLQPEVLLLDEPFGALDAVMRRQMMIELQRIWAAQRTTTILVTHDVGEAIFLADRVIVLAARPGRVAADIPVPFARPRDPALMRSETFHQLADHLIGLLEPGAA